MALPAGVVEVASDPNMSDCELLAEPPASFKGSVRRPPVVLRTGFQDESPGKAPVQVPAAAGDIRRSVDVTIITNTIAKDVRLLDMERFNVNLISPPPKKIMAWVNPRP